MKFKDYIKENTTTPDDLIIDIRNYHHRPEDFDEGDIEDRVFKYKKYVLKDIPIDKLNLDEWQVRDDIVYRIKKEIKNNKKYPPILISPNYSIIDGTHRANALHQLGYKTIKAWVGQK